MKMLRLLTVNLVVFTKCGDGGRGSELLFYGIMVGYGGAGSF